MEEGDAWFNTGDALVYDNHYRLKFLDRTGDTYRSVCCYLHIQYPKYDWIRWKGENTSTEEVTDLISGRDFVNDLCVYGVSVPGYDGKAGMVAISGPVTESNLTELVKHLKKNLQVQSVPIFYRKVEKIPKTANFKTRKIDLINESFDAEDVWILLDSKIKPLSKEIVENLHNLKI